MGIQGPDQREAEGKMDGLKNGMAYLGEFISLGVAFSWAITALCFEYASKRVGALALNLLRLILAFLLLGALLYVFTGSFWPVGADGKTWVWLSMSGLVGFVFGDFCLFYSYVLIGSRFGQLLMTLAPPTAAICGALILHESLHLLAIVGMVVTLCGIAISVISRGEKSGERMHIKLLLKGLWMGIGGGVGQGVGLVFSKLGMEYYGRNAANQSVDVVHMIPFAASQIRIITGIVGFVLILGVSRRLGLLLPAVKDGRAMKALFWGTVFGPFLGVSFSLMAVQYTESGIASTLMALTPVIILLPAAFWLKQKITWAEVIGAIVSVGGVSLFFL